MRRDDRGGTLEGLLALGGNGARRQARRRGHHRVLEHRAALLVHRRHLVERRIHEPAPGILGIGREWTDELERIRAVGVHHHFGGVAQGTAARLVPADPRVPAPERLQLPRVGEAFLAPVVGDHAQRISVRAQRLVGATDLGERIGLPVEPRQLRFVVQARGAPQHGDGVPVAGCREIEALRGVVRRRQAGVGTGEPGAGAPAGRVDHVDDAQVARFGSHGVAGATLRQGEVHERDLQCLGGCGVRGLRQLDDAARLLDRRGIVAGVEQPLELRLGLRRVLRRRGRARDGEQQHAEPARARSVRWGAHGAQQ